MLDAGGRGSVGYSDAYCGPVLAILAGEGRPIRRQEKCMATTTISAMDRKTSLKKIGSRRSSRDYGNNQVIFAEGQRADSIFYIESGNVKRKREAHRIVEARQEGSACDLEKSSILKV